MGTESEKSIRTAGFFRKLLGHWATLAPPPFNKILHRLRGVRIQEPSTVFIGSFVYIDNKHPWLVHVGRGATIAGGARITAHFEPTHAIWDAGMEGGADPVHIGENAFIGVGATVLMGVKVGDCAVVGAAAVVTKDVPDFKIVAGNPAKVIGDVRERKREG